MMNAKEFKLVLLGNEELRNQYDSIVSRLTEEGMKKEEACLKAASEIGYELDPDDLAAADKEGRELSEDELEAVSGGMLWLGDDAPDGHEMFCMLTYWSNWVQFDYAWQYTYCKGSHGTKKHVFGEPYLNKYYVFKDEILVHNCLNCGAVVPLNPEPGDYHG